VKVKKVKISLFKSENKSEKRKKKHFSRAKLKVKSESDYFSLSNVCLPHSSPPTKNKETLHFFSIDLFIHC